MELVKENEKEQLTEDVLLNIYSYLQIADPYIQEHLTCKDIVHLGLLIDKMKEETSRLKDYYNFLDN